MGEQARGARPGSPGATGDERGTDDGARSAAPRELELIAHRAGNGVDTILAARQQRAAATLEVDVHLRRGRLEVRHAKVLWPTSRLWERWYLLPRHVRTPGFEEILRAVDPGTGLLVDLKGIDPRLSRAVLAAIGGRGPVTVAAKAWWMLGAFRQHPAVRTIRSAGNRAELLLLRRLPLGRAVDGFGVKASLLDEQVARELRQHTDTLLAWAVPDRRTADRLEAWGVTGLILDDVELLDQLGRRRGGAEDHAGRRRPGD